MINQITKYIMLLNVAGLGVLGWLMFAPVQLTEIYNDPYPVYPTEVVAGESVHYTVDFEKFMNYRVKSTKTIICENGIYKSLPNSVTEAPIGRHTLETSTLIPDDMPAGRCYIQFNSDAHINVVRVEEIDSRTEWFDIIEG